MRLKIFLFAFQAFLLSTISICGSTKQVFTFELKGEINPVTNRQVKIAFQKADSLRADYIVIELNTYGGAVSDADEIVSTILKTEIPVYIWINNTAGSAGSYISVACDSIYMSKASVIGSSTVVDQQGKVVAEKYQSFMRTKFRTAAQATGKDPDLCAKFVGTNLGTDSAYVLCLTNNEAIDTGLCVMEINRVEEIFIAKGITKIEVTKYKQTLEDRIIDFFVHPAVKSVLVLLIIGGIYYELKTPGLGFPIIASGIAVVLYFVPDYLQGALEHWELLLFVAGVILLILEAFVIPGFGVAGIAGIVCVSTSLVLSMLQNNFFDFQFVLPSELFQSFSVMSIGFFGMVIMVLIAGPLLRNNKHLQKMSVMETIHETANLSIGTFEVGDNGVVYSVLKPYGKVKLRDRIIEAKSMYGVIEEGEMVEIKQIKNNEIIVGLLNNNE